MKKIVLLVLLALALTAPAVAQPLARTWLPATVSGIANATTTRAANITIESYPFLTLSVLVNITAGGTATGNMQIYIEDSSDGGTTWDDLISSNVFALGAVAVTQHFFVTFDLASTATQGAAAAAETLAAGTARQGPIGSLLRIREKISGASGSPVGATYTITAVLK